MWQFPMHQILLCAQRSISQERIMSERPHGVGGGKWEVPGTAG